MRFRTAIVIAGVLVGAVFGFAPVMTKIVERSIAQGQQLTKLENSLFIASLLCREFWWLLVPAILVFFLLIATITAVIRHFRKKTVKEAGASTAAQ